MITALSTSVRKAPSTIHKIAHSGFVKKALPILSKAAGVAGTAIILYDANALGKEKAKVKDQIDTGDRLANNYYKYMTSNTSSKTVNALKEQVFKTQFGNGLPHIGSRICGYISGATSSLLSGIIPLGLSIGAIATKKKPSIICAAGLGLVGLKTLIVDIFGCTKKNLINKQ